ncbi:hypothetical protein T09_12295 [Trichinella sp. T9]|nr:hypothetical protein T09_11632 [Trichinella sp. T9]KRX41344.1 hypothetical protein T09_12295 [Trichinella sp. T9]
MSSGLHLKSSRSVLSIRGLLAEERNKIRYYHPKFAC